MLQKKIIIEMNKSKTDLFIKKDKEVLYGNTISTSSNKQIEQLRLNNNA